MKSNVESRIKNFQQDIDKFAARWYQLKPGDDALDGNHTQCMAAVKSIRERKEEFTELDNNKQSLV